MKFKRFKSKKLYLADLAKSLNLAKLEKLPKLPKLSKLPNSRLLPNPSLLRFVLAILIIFSFLSFGLVRAGAVSPSLTVAPHTFDIKVKRGEVFKNKIRILNQSDVPIPITIKITDFSAAEDSGQMIFDESVEDKAVASRFWIKIENPNFILDPGETQKVNFQIEVPENAVPGGHYSLVLFEPRFPEYYFKKGQPRVIPMIGVLFLISVEVEGLKKVKKPLKIVEFNVPEKTHFSKLENFIGSIYKALKTVKKTFFIVGKRSFTFDFKVKNDDIFHHKLEGKLIILDSKGNVVGEKKIGKITILPGKARQISVEFNPEIPGYLKWLPASVSNFLAKNLSFGKYKAKLFLTSEDKTLEDTVEFWVFPLKSALIFIFAIIVLILMRKRISLALKALFKLK